MKIRPVRLQGLPDQHGILRDQIISRGGIPIESRVFVAHRERVVAAWWALAAEEAMKPEKQRARAIRIRQVVTLLRAEPKRLTGTR